MEIKVAFYLGKHFFVRIFYFFVKLSFFVKIYLSVKESCWKNLQCEKDNYKSGNKTFDKKRLLSLVNFDEKIKKILTKKEAKISAPHANNEKLL